jgi:hypothetical protein
MKHGRCSVEQIVFALKQVEPGMAVPVDCSRPCRPKHFGQRSFSDPGGTRFSKSVSIEASS